jgi:hypothetical protein
VALDGADGDAFEALLNDAIAFAKAVLGADAAANLGEVVGGGADFVCFLHPALGAQLQPVGDVVRQGAVYGAERDAALAAAAGLRFRGGLIEAAVDFLEIFTAYGHGTLLRRLLREADELQHAFGHDVSRVSTFRSYIGRANSVGEALFRVTSIVLSYKWTK